MSLFDDDMFNDLNDLDESIVSKILLASYKDILGERISEKINEFTIEIKKKTNNCSMFYEENFLNG